jgi:hypothetical protein
MITGRMAAVLYAVLTGISIATLHGKALVFALIIVLGLAVKSYLDYLRRRLQ